MSLDLISKTSIKKCTEEIIPKYTRGICTEPAGGGVGGLKNALFH